MFILNNKPLSLDRAFTTEDGTQYPANWLRLATPEQRAALGITEAPPEPVYDQRFYWGPDNPKDHGQLVEQWTATIKQTAGSLLSQTDWYITRQSETGVAAPPDVLNQRSLIRTLSNEKEAFLAATTTTEELANYVTSPSFHSWEKVEEEEEELIDVTAYTASGTFTTGFGGEAVDTIALE